jgi:uncharacterized NAD-dependent epimerase/dehydratase family protein
VELLSPLPRPYALFLGDVTEPAYAKTAFGLRDWAAQDCIAEVALPEASVTTGLPRLSPAEAFAAGARGLVIGVAHPGGALQPSWISLMVVAVEAGLDLVSGTHGSIADHPEIRGALQRCGRRAFDVRKPPNGLPAASGRKRTGKRLLTVGTDCALGKKYTALALTRAFAARGERVDFRATGQTGIMIAGSGVPIDAVVSDFVAGAAEVLSPDAAPEHWDVIEGQGSLFHPAYAGVSLGLLHGSQPDVVVLCHEAGRERAVGWPDYLLPSLSETIDLTLRLAARTNPRVRCAGVSLNTAALSPGAAEKALETAEGEMGLPAADPIRGGSRFDRLVESCLERGR